MTSMVSWCGIGHMLAICSTVDEREHEPSAVIEGQRHDLVEGLHELWNAEAGRGREDVQVVERLERLRGSEIVAERFLGHDAAAPRATGAAKLFDHGREQTLRNGEIVQRPLCRTELTTQKIEGRRISVIAVDKAKQRRELVEGRAVDAAAVRLQAVLCTGPELIEAPPRLRDTDDRHVQMPALHHRLERREDLLVREVSRRAEEDQGIGGGRRQ